MFGMFHGKEYCGHVCNGKEYCGHVCEVSW